MADYIVRYHIAISIQIQISIQNQISVRIRALFAFFGIRKCARKLVENQVKVLDLVSTGGLTRGVQVSATEPEGFPSLVRIRACSFRRSYSISSKIFSIV